MQKAKAMTEITVANVTLGNHQPMSLIGGMNVIESRDLVMRVAEAFVKVTGELGLPYIFKASFDKANRSSIHSFMKFPRPRQWLKSAISCRCQRSWRDKPI
jgi:3-deoxy-D-manno-octulosonic acid (KDO) 8-phosphate synthase